VALKLGDRDGVNRVRDAYLWWVRSRVHRPHNLREADEPLLPRVAENAHRCGADVALFIEAQFRLMSNLFCRKTWHVAYPPLAFLVTEGARWRWRRSTLGRLSVSTEADEGPGLNESRSLANRLRHDDNELALAAIDGRLHPQVVRELIESNRIRGDIATWLSNSSDGTTPVSDKPRRRLTPSP
jgi:hypothetical protein